MAYTLAYRITRVPLIPTRMGPTQAGVPPSPDRREHFGTEEAALRRARELLPAADWIDLRLFGPDGRMLAGQRALEQRLGVAENGGQPAGS